VSERLVAFCREVPS